MPLGSSLFFFVTLFLFSWEKERERWCREPNQLTEAFLYLNFLFNSWKCVLIITLHSIVHLFRTVERIPFVLLCTRILFFWIYLFIFFTTILCVNIYQTQKIKKKHSKYFHNEKIMMMMQLIWNFDNRKNTHCKFSEQRRPANELINMYICMLRAHFFCCFFRYRHNSTKPNQFNEQLNSPANK